MEIMSFERLLIHRPSMAPLSPPVCSGHLILSCDLTRGCASLVVRTAESSRCLRGKVGLDFIIWWRMAALPPGEPLGRMVTFPRCEWEITSLGPEKCSWEFPGPHCQCREFLPKEGKAGMASLRG